MSAVGSQAWVDALDAALRALSPAGTTGDVVVQQELTDTGSAWHVTVSGGVARARVGRHAEPDVTFSQDTATAAAIGAGELSAQTAFIDGRLRVRGDVGRLTEVADLLGRMPAIAVVGGR